MLITQRNALISSNDFDLTLFCSTKSNKKKRTQRSFYNSKFYDFILFFLKNLHDFNHINEAIFNKRHGL